MKILLQYILLFGIFCLPLINSRITSLLGFSFSMPVNGNFEFTKVMFFNVWSSLAILVYFFYSFFSKDKNIIFSFGAFFLYILLLISTYFSVSPYVSFFGNEIKAHSFLVGSNLIGLFIVFQNILSKDFFKKIIFTFVFSGVFVSILGLKEYFFPSFDYGDLGNRLFSTFGHPNYVSIFLVALMPFLYKASSSFSGMKKVAGVSIILLFTITLLLTKSVFAIFLFICFTIYYFWSKELNPFVNNTRYTSVFLTQQKALAFGVGFILLLSGFLIFAFFPEKLHSFVSRFFIWETTLKVVFSDMQIFLLGGGLGTFIYYFDNFKSEYLYVFENLGFGADRPHNIILNSFYHFGFGGLIFILGLYYKIVNLKYSVEKFSLVLIFSFLLLNFASIVLYLFIVILLSFAFLERKIVSSTFVGVKKLYKYIFGKALLLVILLFSVFGSYSSMQFYISETYVYTNNLTDAKKIYSYNANNYFFSGDFEKGLEISQLKTPEYYFSKIFFSKDQAQKIIICKDFISDFTYAETYFFCGNSFWNDGEKGIARTYYSAGLSLLPDLWKINSEYYNKFLIKNFNITGNRFLSEKYGLKTILDRGE